MKTTLLISAPLALVIITFFYIKCTKLSPMHEKDADMQYKMLSSKIRKHLFLICAASIIYSFCIYVSGLDKIRFLNFVTVIPLIYWGFVTYHRNLHAPFSDHNEYISDGAVYVVRETRSQIRIVILPAIISIAYCICIFTVFSIDTGNHPQTVITNLQALVLLFFLVMPDPNPISSLRNFPFICIIIWLFASYDLWLDVSQFLLICIFPCMMMMFDFREMKLIEKKSFTSIPNRSMQELHVVAEKPPSTWSEIRKDKMQIENAKNIFSVMDTKDSKRALCYIDFLEAIDNQYTDEDSEWLPFDKIAGIVNKYIIQMDKESEFYLEISNKTRTECVSKYHAICDRNSMMRNPPKLLYRDSPFKRVSIEIQTNLNVLLYDLKL